jgi:hypothetical protein
LFFIYKTREENFGRSAAGELILQGFGEAFLQALHRRQRHRLHQPVRVPAERVRQLCCRATGRNQLDAIYGDVHARDGVAAREADGLAAPWVVRAADVPVRDADDAQGETLVSAPSAETVVLIDDDAVLDVLHGHAGELDGRHSAGAALPRLDPDAVVGVDDAHVPDRDVGYAGARVGHTTRLPMLERAHHVERSRCVMYTLA